MQGNGYVKNEKLNVKNMSVSSISDTGIILNELKKTSFTKRRTNYVISSPAHSLIALFQQVESNDAFEVLKKEGLPELRRLFSEGKAHPQNYESELMLILKILALYKQKSDAVFITDLLKEGFLSDEFMWSIIFRTFDEKHPYLKFVLGELKVTLPQGFACVAYLDFVNRHVIEGRINSHSFNTKIGVKKLIEFFQDKDKNHFSYAFSAATALPFLSLDNQDQLFPLANRHPDALVRLESAWAMTKVGKETGLKELQKWAKDVKYSKIACEYLKELNLKDKIPDEVKGKNFKAMAEMCSWLSHPNEFGEPPTKIELFDKRVLFWPPTNDKRTVWLFKYEYPPYEDGEDLVKGISMVGSVTFALFGEAKVDLSPEDVYGLHCVWELELNEDERAPTNRTKEAGRKILKKFNPGSGF